MARLDARAGERTRTLAGLALGLTLAACSGGGGGAPADAPSDAALDAADGAVDAPPVPTVTVRVLRARTPRAPAPVAGALVFTSDVAGAPLAEGLTDAAGEIVLAIEAGGAVTARVRSAGNHHWLSSIVGVEPGDVLTIDPLRDELLAGGPGVTYQWPAPPDADGNPTFDQVVLDDGCWHLVVRTFAPDPPVPPLPRSATLAVVPGCGTDPRDVVVTAHDVDRLAGYAILPAVPAVVGSTATAAAWARPDTTFTATAVDLPAAALTYAAQAAPVVNGHWAPGPALSARVTDGTATVVAPWASAFAEVRVRHQIASDRFGSQVCAIDAPRGAHGATLDGATLLPLVGPATVDRFGRRVEWTQDTGAAADETRVALTYRGPGLDPVVEWSLRAPPGLTSLALPSLPTSLANLALQGGWTGSATVTLFDLGTITSWAEMRALSYQAAEVDAYHSRRYGRVCRSWR